MNSDVYLAGLVLKKLLQTYSNGIEGQQVDSEKKAKMIYDVLDANPSKFEVSNPRIVTYIPDFTDTSTGRTRCQRPLQNEHLFPPARKWRSIRDC